MAVERTFTGYIVIQFRDETTRKYEVEMYEAGVDGMKTKIAELNTELANTSSLSAFGTTFLSSSEDTVNPTDRQAAKIIEGGVTITEEEIVYTVN